MLVVVPSVTAQSKQNTLCNIKVSPNVLANINAEILNSFLNITSLQEKCS